MTLYGREIDRSRTLATLRAGRCAVLRGAAGIGKTELWRDVLAALEVEGFEVGRVVATETTRLIPSGVFAGLVARATLPDAAGRIVGTLHALAALGPRAVIGVDDAHLLDDESAAAVHQHALAGGVLLLTVRAGEPAPDAVTRFWKDGLADLVELGPLDAEACAALVEELAGAPVEALTQARLLAASGGNPLLVRELVAHGRARGALTDLGGIYSWSGEIDASPNVAAFLRERLADLEPAVRSIAEGLAVGGPQPRALFERIVSGPALAAARRAGILRERRHGATEMVDLAHPLYGPVLAESLRAERVRALLEGLVAAAEPLAATDCDLAVLLAAWLVRLADRSRPDVLVTAAERAFTRGDLALAERLARAAVEAGAADAARAITTRIRGFLGGPVEEGARENPAIAFEAAMARGDAFLVGVGTLDAALGTLHAAERSLADELRREVAAHVLNLQLYAGAPAGPLLAEVTPYLEDEAHPRVVARAGMAAGPALTVSGRTLDAIAVLERGIAAADASGFSPFLRDRAAAMRVQCLLHAGRLADAHEEAKRRHAAAEAEGDVPALGTWSQVLAQVLLWQGRPREAARRFGEALALMRGIDIVGYSRWCQAELALSLAWAGGVRDDAKLPSVPEPGSHGALLAPLIELALAGRSVCLGAAGDAARRAADAARRAVGTGQTLIELFAEHLLLRLRPTRARAAHVAELASRCQGDYAAALAESGEALGSGRGADLERSAGRFAALGLAPLAAEFFARAALAYREERASAASRRAGNLAEEQRARMEADAPLPVAAHGAADELTAREREVAELAARGLTNQEIARRLEVSVRTVHAHLRTVYDKLGVNERRHLAALLQRGSSDAGESVGDA